MVRKIQKRAWIEDEQISVSPAMADPNEWYSVPEKVIVDIANKYFDGVMGVVVGNENEIGVTGDRLNQDWPSFAPLFEEVAMPVEPVGILEEVEAETPEEMLVTSSLKRIKKRAGDVLPEEPRDYGARPQPKIGPIYDSEGRLWGNLGESGNPLSFKFDPDRFFTAKDIVVSLWDAGLLAINPKEETAQQAHGGPAFNMLMKFRARWRKYYANKEGKTDGNVVKAAGGVWRIKGSFLNENPVAAFANLPFGEGDGEVLYGPGDLPEEFRGKGKPRKRSPKVVPEPEEALGVKVIGDVLDPEGYQFYGSAVKALIRAILGVSDQLGVDLEGLAKLLPAEKPLGKLFALVPPTELDLDTEKGTLTIPPSVPAREIKKIIESFA